MDDLFKTDGYGRVIAVVYVRHNGAELSNTNECLLRIDLAETAGFPNESDHISRTPRVRHPSKARQDAGFPVNDFAIGVEVTPIGLCATVLALLRWHRRSSG